MTIFNPNGTEVTEIVLPDGTTASEVLAPDGSVVFGSDGAVGSVSQPASGILRYRFEEGSGTTATDDWGGNDGTISGATYVTGSFQETYALSFDGSDDNVSLPSGLVDTSGFSISLWTNPDGTGGDRQNLWGLKADIDADLRVNNYGSWQFGLYDGSSFNTVTAAYTTGTYQHIVCTYDGSVAEIYLDGSPVDSNTTGLVTKSESNVIGATSENTRNYAGDVDDARVYDKALSDTEVSDLYSTGTI